MTQAEEKVRRYLGLALRASSAPGVKQVGTVLVNTVIASTMVFAVSAPG